MTVIEAYLRTLHEDCRESFRPTVEHLQRKGVTENTSKRAEEERAWLVLDWLARGIVFAWFENAGRDSSNFNGFKDQLEKLRMWPAITRETASVILEELEAFDQQTMMPVAMAGKVEAINSETDQTLDLTRWCGVWAAGDWHVNAAVQGIDAGAAVFGHIVATATRVVLTAMRLSVRQGDLSAEAGVANTVDRCERSITPLLERLFVVK